MIKALRAGQQNLDSEILQYPWGSDLPNKTKFCKKFKDPISKKEFAIVNSLKIDNFYRTDLGLTTRSTARFRANRPSVLGMPIKIGAYKI